MISSKQNGLIKEVRALLDKKGRQASGEYLVEGVKLVEEVLSLSLPVRIILATEEYFTRFSGKFSNVVEVSDEVIKSVSDTVTPQGVVAVVKKPVFSPVLSNESCLFLDGIADPGNLGTIIRTSAAAGVKNIYLASCADPYSPKTVRSAMGGLFRVNLYEGEREELVKFIGSPVVVASMEGENVFTVNLPENLCIVIGNEANGVSSFMREKANYTVSIPMQNGVESLNAGVSAAILTYMLLSRNVK